MSIPAFQSQSIIDNINISNNTSITNIKKDNIDNIKFMVCQFQKDGIHKKNVKELTSKESYDMMIKLINTKVTESTPKEIFEEKLLILKEYNLVSSNISLNDLMDVGKLEYFCSHEFNISQMKPFVAFMAPIFIGGMGFGAGFGFRNLPLIRRIAGNILSAGLIGLGAVVCFDILNAVINFQFTFTLPFLIHVITGFVGIMLFAFDSIFPPIPGKPPVSIYSNIVALGMAGSAIGFLLPPIEE
jgi:hypothetical protein